MAGDVVLLVLGFVLTTVVGGALGYFFQNRAWRNQNEARLAEAEREAATTACIELSTLLDKRLFRMRQLDDVLLKSTLAEEELEPHLERYREIRYDWNDGLNRNLARAQTYFGTAVKRELELIYELVSGIHDGLRRRVDAYYEGGAAGESQRAALDELSDRIYDFSARMGDLIRDDRVGRRNPDEAGRRQRRRRWTAIRPS